LLKPKGSHGELPGCLFSLVKMNLMFQKCALTQSKKFRADNLFKDNEQKPDKSMSQMSAPPLLTMLLWVDIFKFIKLRRLEILKKTRK
jgi:hypothetical protein